MQATAQALLTGNTTVYVCQISQEISHILALSVLNVADGQSGKTTVSVAHCIAAKQKKSQNDIG